MSYPQYSRVEPFSPLDGDGRTIFRSPASYSQPWAGSPDGDLSALGIEMNETRPPLPPRNRESGTSFHSSPGGTEVNETRPPLPPRNRESGISSYSSASTLFPSTSQSAIEAQSFLHDPMNKLDTSYSSTSSVPYKDRTGRQLRHILMGSSFRWFITAGLCAGYILSTIIWQNKGVISENQKKLYNAITTGISIAIGLNIASAFKDMALNMRWPILSARKRSLVELDLILNADSLTKLAKLAIVAKRPAVTFACLLWLFINILAQAGIAMLSLTYGFEVDYNGVLMNLGNVTIPDMRHFYPQGNNTSPSVQDEQYTAHLYGGLAYDYGMNETKYMPKAGSIYRDTNAMLWYDYDNSNMEFIFSDSPAPQTLGTFSVYTNRTINITYVCDAHEVTANGNGSFNDIQVANVGQVYVSHKVPSSITYFTNSDNVCGNGSSLRCSVVEVFEASDTDPWYYKCNITLGKTQNDPQNLSQISDLMAFKATSSIAQVGYTDDSGQEAQIYPQNSLWGMPLQGDRDAMGLTVATFALGSIAGASMFNPYTSYMGQVPSQGFYLNLGHPYFFYLIIGMICGCQLLFCVIVAVFSNQVMVGPDAHLSMSLLLRPIADALEGVSGGRKNRAYKDAKKHTQVRYEKAMNGRWILNMA